MNTVFMLAEILTTFIEGILLFSTVELLCGSKWTGKKRAITKILCALLYTFVILLLNRIELFSILTLSIGIIVSAIISLLFGNKDFWYQLLVVSLFVLVVVIIDSVTNIIFGVASGNAKLPTQIVSTVGLSRTIYILFVKGINVIAYYIFKAMSNKAPRYPISSLVISLILSVVAFASVHFTYDAVLSLSIEKMQLSLAMAWIAMLAAVTLIQILFSFQVKQKEKEQENEMLQSVNAMIEKNYENLERSYLENAKNIHDFRHHVMALDELLTEGEFEEAQGYIRSLHEAEAHGFSAVITGNAVIDAVLNAHHSSAQASGIDFSVTAQPLPDLTMGSWELSTLFSNLLENAREACEKVKGRDPWIEVKISVANRFLLLEIRNTSDSRPEEKDWKTTKREKQGHGLGLLSVEDIVEKYNGSVKRSCLEDGIVEVSVMCETISTITDNN